MQIYFKSTQAMTEQLVRKFTACSMLWVHGHQKRASCADIQCPLGVSEETAATGQRPFPGVRRADCRKKGGDMTKRPGISLGSRPASPGAPLSCTCTQTCGRFSSSVPRSVALTLGSFRPFTFSILSYTHVYPQSAYTNCYFCVYVWVVKYT